MSRLLLASVIVAGSWLPQSNASHAAQIQQAPVALDGYCAVCLIKAKKWVKGSVEHSVVYDGRTYLFPSNQEAEMFEQNPEQFVPALGGDCIVCYAKMDQRVPGKLQHGAFHRGRAFFFPGPKEKQMFMENPAAFADADIALNGNCAVCLQKMGKNVAGKQEFTAIHHGMRYLFPSDREREMFLQNPAEFAQQANLDSAATSEPAGANQAKAELITITGRAGCAACEHGVRPLGASDTLGLAVNTKDRIYVVEDADQLYPTIYQNRFAGDTLKLSGTVIKEQGKIVWIRASNVQLVR